MSNPREFKKILTIESIMIQGTRCIICQENEKTSKLLSYVLSDYLAKGTLSALKRSALCEILNFYLDHSRPKNNHHQENF